MKKFEVRHLDRESEVPHGFVSIATIRDRGTEQDAQRVLGMAGRGLIEAVKLKPKYDKREARAVRGNVFVNPDNMNNMKSPAVKALHERLVTVRGGGRYTVEMRNQSMVVLRRGELNGTAVKPAAAPANKVPATELVLDKATPSGSSDAERTAGFMERLEHLHQETLQALQQQNAMMQRLEKLWA